MPTREDWRYFGAWAVIGALSMWSTWTLLRLGWILLIIAIAAAVNLATTTEPGRSGWGFVAGLGAVPLWIGLANRSAGGPMDQVWWWGSGALTVLVALAAFLRPRPAHDDEETVGTPD